MALVTCTSKDFAGLKNPYTGEDMVVKMMTCPDGRCLFAAPDTYSTAGFEAGPKEAYQRWATSEGFEGVRVGKPIQCAYTGESLSIEKTESGVHYLGGFDPCMFRPRAEFLYYAWMRDGESPFPKPQPDTPVMSGTSAQHKVERQETKITQDAIDHASSAMEAARAKGAKFEKHATSGWTPRRKK